MVKREIKLDLKDKKILYLIDFDARMPYTQIAKKVGLSKQGAEYKINNLIKKEVIKGFYPVINTPKLGYLYCRLSMAFQNMTESKERELLNYLKKDKRYFWVFTAQGVFDMLVGIWAKSVSEFRETIHDFLSKFGKYVRVKHESIATDVIHYQHRYLLNKKETRELHIKESNEVIELKKVEKDILKALCEDTRNSLVNIADKLNLSPKVVAYTIKNLEKKDIIKGYRPILNHNKLGYTYFKLFINVYHMDVNEMEKLHDYIKKNPIVIYNIKGIGLFEELDIEVMVKDNTELFEFIKDLKFKFPSLVGDYKTFMYEDTQKVRYLPF